MLKRLIALALALTTTYSFGQTKPGSLKGTVTVKETGETLPNANIVVKDNAGTKITGGSANLDGQYNINPIDPGVYTIECSFVGMPNAVLNNVTISSGTVRVLNISLSDKGVLIGPIDIVAPMIEPGKIVDALDPEELTDAGRKPLEDMLVTMPKVARNGNGDILLAGGRPEATRFKFNNIPMLTRPNIPITAINEVKVMAGGLEARHGDALGGVINITTKGPSGVPYGSVEFMTSAPFDDSGFNLAALTLGGPLFKNWKNKHNQNVLGYLLSSEFQYQIEPRLTNIPYVALDSDVLNSLKERPIEINASGTSIVNRAEFVEESSLSDIQARPNSWRSDLRMVGELQIRTSKYTILTMGGLLNHSNGKIASYGNHLFNFENNRDNITSNWSSYIRFRQAFPTDKNGRGVLRNVYYNVQLDYTRNSSESFDRRFGTDFFKYGYTGKYDLQQERAYAYGTDEESGLPGWRFTGLRDTAVVYTPSQTNNTLTNYVSTYFDLAEEFGGLDTRTINDLIGNGLPVNGNNPSSVYGLWGNVGAVQGGYSKSRNSQFRVTASSNFDINDHSLMVGIEYEQRSDRFFSVGATGLWNQMRLLQNLPNQQLDLANPLPVFDDQGVFQDTIEYNYLYSPNDASRFSESVRRALGLDPFGTDQINIDNMDPNLFSLDMFSADELVNPNGTRYVNYYGYDYTGAFQSRQPTINDFFTATDGDGRLSRPVGAFQPIYIAGYIQDQFTFKDFHFNAGIRVDRFDLNQSVLRDPYILYPHYTVSDLASSPLGDRLDDVPGGIGGDYAVYVNSFDYNSEDLQIVGYRSGDFWFDANGRPLTDPADLAEAAGGGIKPFLQDPRINSGDEGDATLTRGLPASSFKDYDPQTVVMPRVSFSFPITDEAMFIAHYDVLAQRPTPAMSRLDPFSYLDLANRQNPGVINNPDLKPQRTTDFEIGFKQVLTDNSALKISAYYRELRDMLQTVNFAQAYPLAYVAYGNRDFGTVKGFTLEYEMRRVNNIRLDANYTLQFADGTGSSANSGVNLATNGQPNLRYILPFDYDNRHQLSARFDFRYSSGKNYNGPVWWNRRVFENFGINVTCNAVSGTPYTKRDNPFPLTSSASAAAQVEGQINGSRLPWQVTFDTRINKVFNIRKKGRDPKSKTPPQSIEVYIQVLNLFNTQNIVNVYPFTGSATDDGYLVSPEAQSQLSSQTSAQSYVDLYNRRVANPFNFTLPRQIRFGVGYRF